MEPLWQQARRLNLIITGIDELYYAYARRSGLPDNTLCLLYALDDGQPHWQKQICQEWGMPRTTLNSTIKVCQAAGYLTLEAMPGHRRERLICLTESGRAYARQMLAPLYEAEEQAMAKTLADFPGSAFLEAMAAYERHLRAAYAGQQEETTQGKDNDTP